MTNLRKLENEVRAASLANRVRRRVIAERWTLLGQGIIKAAGKPVVLGSGVLIGFCLGHREARSSSRTGRASSWVITRILLFAVNYLVQATSQDTRHPTAEVKF